MLAVNSTSLYKQGATAKYKITLVNGAEPVPTTSNINLVVSSSSGYLPGALVGCEAPAATNVALPQPGLLEYKSLTCYINHVVSAADIDSGALPAFNVTAVVGTSSYAQMTVDAIPLFTGLPCRNCRACLSTMTALLAPLVTETDPALIANAFAPACLKSYSSSACNQTTAAILSSTTGNFGKRFGMLCKAVGACDPTQFEASCSLADNALVPAGSLDVCSVPGTTGGTALAIPNRVAAGTLLATGLCFNTQGNNSGCADTKMCATDSITGYQCVCNRTTGIETCTPYYTCVDTPCTKCRNCMATAKAFTDKWQAETSSSSIAAAFKLDCLNKGNTLQACSELALKIEASYHGNMGKRPGLLCQSSCNVSADCVVAANKTANLTVTPVLYAGNYSLCTVDGASWSAVAGIPVVANNTCGVNSDCNTTNNEICTFAAGDQNCACDATSGKDACTDVGYCKAINCATCQACLTAVNAFVKRNLKVVDPAVIKADWLATCGSANGASADCAASAEAIASSPHGNVGKRAATLCSRIYSKCGCVVC